MGCTSVFYVLVVPLLVLPTGGIVRNMYLSLEFSASTVLCCGFRADYGV